MDGVGFPSSGEDGCHVSDGAGGNQSCHCVAMDPHLRGDDEFFLGVIPTKVGIQVFIKKRGTKVPR